MNRTISTAVLCLSVALFSASLVSDVHAGHRPRGGYGHGYYAQSYPAGYRNAYYGNGYYYTNPYYSQGVLYNYYGGYRPSYSWGLYNGGSGVYADGYSDGYSEAVPYDYAPYQYKNATHIDAVYSTYGNFGYDSVDCRSCND